MTAAVCALLAAALAIWPGVCRRPEASRPTAGRAEVDDERGLAAGWDLLAAALRSGLPVPVAVRAVAGGAPTEVAEALRSAAGLLELGAEPAEAWAAAGACPATAELARAARRTARTGIALAGVAESLAERARSALEDKAEARAGRLGVLVIMPLALCFLPAFFCLGVLPAVLGLAGTLFTP